MNQILGVGLSPFVRKVLLCCDYKGIEYENLLIMPGDESEDFRRISPLGKVPAFKDDYVELCDSSVIFDYLEGKYPQPALLPSSPQDRARALWFEEFADSALIPHLGAGMFFEKLVGPAMRGTTCNPAVVAAAEEAMKPLQDYLEQQLHGEFLVGGAMSIADLSVASVFLNASFADYEVDASHWPKLSAYLKALWGSDLFKPHIEADHAMLAAFQG